MPSWLVQAASHLARGLRDLLAPGDPGRTALVRSRDLLLVILHGEEVEAQRHGRLAARDPGLASLHGQHVLLLVVADVAEDIVQGRARRAADLAHGRQSGLELVEEVEISSPVVLDSHRRRRQRLQQLLVRVPELTVRVHRMGLDEAAEVVRPARVDEEEPDEDPVVGDGAVLRKEPVQPPLVAAQGLHDEEVVQLVVLLGRVHGAELRRAPPAKRLVEVQAGRVRKVWHACDRLQEPEPLDRPVLEHHVDELAQHVIDNAYRRRRGHVLARTGASALPLFHGLVAQLQHRHKLRDQAARDGVAALRRLQ
mmetsp:Transcript_88624/g.228576  ORF Transcript_88624/g.228576 Transcript_88624/m.228576 type:complete len:310 (+) Transcript_88624:39-968(+)